MSDDPNMTLVLSAFEAVLPQLEQDPTSDSAWSAIELTIAHHGVGDDVDPELGTAISEHDATGLKTIVDQWNSGERLLLVRDRDVLKRALKAYRKSLKVTVLNAESSLGGGPMSSGRKSTIVGIIPPIRYPRETWDYLVRQKKLVDGGQGTYELAPGM